MLAIAIVQVAAIVAIALAARRVSRLAEQLQQDIKPLFTQLNAIASDASRAAALAATQVERIDRLAADACTRVEQTLGVIQTTIESPLREGRAFVNAFRAGLAMLRDFQQARRQKRGAGEEDENLFI